MQYPAQVLAHCYSYYLFSHEQMEGQSPLEPSELGLSPVCLLSCSMLSHSSGLGGSGWRHKVCTGFQCQLCSGMAKWPWASSLTSQAPTVFNCKMEIAGLMSDKIKFQRQDILSKCQPFLSPWISLPLLSPRDEPSLVTYSHKIPQPSWAFKPFLDNI